MREISCVAEIHTQLLGAKNNDTVHVCRYTIAKIAVQSIQFYLSFSNFNHFQTKLSIFVC